MDKTKRNEIVKIIVFALIVVWILCFFIDYFRARDAQMPIFCFSRTVKEYHDGTTTSCTGLGYKMYKYDRNSIPVTVQFGPFFIKERTQ